MNKRNGKENNNNKKTLFFYYNFEIFILLKDNGKLSNLGLLECQIKPFSLLIIILLKD